MDLKDDLELAVTRQKLQVLTDRYEESRRETGGDAYVRELSQRTLKRWMNKLQEQIVRYEIHRKATVGQPES